MRGALKKKHLFIATEHKSVWGSVIGSQRLMSLTQIQWYLLHLVKIVTLFHLTLIFPYSVTGKLCNPLCAGRNREISCLCIPWGRCSFPVEWNIIFEFSPHCVLRHNHSLSSIVTALFSQEKRKLDIIMGSHLATHKTSMWTNTTYWDSVLFTAQYALDTA